MDHILDFNGTVYEPPEETSTLSKLGYAVLFDRLRHCDFERARELLETKKKLSALKEEISNTSFYDARREDIVREMYKIFNEEVIDGLPYEFVRKKVDKFAKKAKSDMDKRILEPLKFLKSEKPYVKFGIISGTWEHTIEALLEKAGYPGLFDKMVGTLLEEENGTAKGFDIRAYGKENKIRYLESEFFNGEFNPEETCYWGDGNESKKCFEYMENHGGKLCIPLFLSESSDPKDQKFIKGCREEFPNLIVPKNQEDCQKIILGD